MTKALTPDLLLRAYAAGIFPMAESRDDPTIHWIDPRQRGIFPLNGFHISRSLRRSILKGGFSISADADFAATVAACANRPETWINPEIFRLYDALHHLGHAHSVEVRRDGRLVGGVYGVVLGAAFFGESMFSTETDASKVALAWLIHRLRAGGFTLFDTQFLTPHLASLGAMEIPRTEYRRRLADALDRQARFAPPGYCPSPSSVAGSSGGSSSPVS
ncbi:MAG: leucyl/phenylalanyl-tRNA--protein transferase [Paracoccaceae bacterium]